MSRMKLELALEPEKYAEGLSYTVQAMIATARLALENETSSSELTDRAAYVVEQTLSVAQVIAGLVTVGIERLRYVNRQDRGEVSGPSDRHSGSRTELNKATAADL